MLRHNDDRVAAAQELVELADEAIRARDFQKAEARLRAQLRLYPNGPEAGQGKLLLGTALAASASSSTSENSPGG